MVFSTPGRLSSHVPAGLPSRMHSQHGYWLLMHAKKSPSSMNVQIYKR